MATIVLNNCSILNCRNLRNSRIGQPSLKNKFFHRNVDIKFPTLKRRVNLDLCKASTSNSAQKGDVQLEGLFKDIDVLKSDGSSVNLVTLWEERRVIIAWARHFGCLLCKKRAAELSSRIDDLKSSNITIIIIGPGSLEQIRTFEESFEFPGEIYADPDYLTFEKLGFVKGAGTIFTPKALVNLVGAQLEGFSQDWNLSLKKDTILRGGWQQGGVMVAGPGKNALIFLHKDKEAGDEPNWEDVFSAALNG